MIVNCAGRPNSVALEMNDDEFCWLVSSVYGVNRTQALEVLANLRKRETTTGFARLDVLVEEVTRAHKFA